MSQENPYGCERCGKAAELGELDYCAYCSRNLCPPCMAKGCCGRVPAESGDAIDNDAERESLR